MSIWSRLYNGETSFDFIGRRKLWLLISALVILLGVVSLATRGLNFGIDFEGGTAWEVPAGDVSVGEARDALRDEGLGDARIQIVGGDVLRVTGDEATPEKRDEVLSALVELTGADAADASVNQVGPSWGEDISRKAQRALIIFLLAITVYITLRFEWKMALATLAALFHDIFVTVGVFSLSGFEVTPATVIATLTILGYSIYDGIVVFDKIDENTKGMAASGRMTYGDMVNLSLNQVLMRTLNTSITALLPILSLLVIGSFILGATTLQEFALALLIGLTASAYSSIFIASPLLALLKEREPRYAAVRQRLGNRAGVAGPLSPAAAAASGVLPTADRGDGESAAVPAGVSGGGPKLAPPRPRPSTPPRPRKKGRRR